MKLFVLSPDKHGKIDGTVKHTILDRLPQTRTMSEADAVVVPISFFPDYAYNTALEGVRKPVILLDFTEYGWNYWDHPGRRTHFFGSGDLAPSLRDNPEWQSLDAWAFHHGAALTFKRELLATDAGPKVRPGEFTCTMPEAPLQSREEFDRRPFEVFNCWGYSHPARPRLHGDIFHGMGSRGIDLISDWSQLPGAPSRPRLWVSIFSPYWVRQPLGRVIETQRMSKISVSLPGAGIKCVRSGESPVDCIMALHNDELAWSHPWQDGGNCIRLPSGGEFDALEAAHHNPDLYEIYKASRENIDRYRSDRYVREYIIPAIEEAIP